MMMFTINLIGLGIGPLLVGGLSDLLRPDMGDADALRFAIIVTAVTAKLACVVHFLLAARSIESDTAP